ncbi:uncharacterized protein C8R40DRAFT_1178414 [Lentinula edodes]|uniref:uncharacterized protein n=1 Tax=Lentinula edodes TaxID=5353 RepID=UPI001E8D1EAC|nr:uncharacterized protein C8R40DRAFT_1178414 [Lentinula edodes]KAH7867939.1 hypothetical protein C8R40DRAFT_1178414 [Lentinula edodes]
MESRDIRFKEGEAHCSREYRSEVDNSDLEDCQQVAPTNGPTAQQHADQEGKEPWTSGPTSDTSDTTPPLCRSTHTCTPSRVAIENQALKEHKCKAQVNREDWVTNLPSTGQTLALIAVNPWAFASVTSLLPGPPSQAHTPLGALTSEAHILY